MTGTTPARLSEEFKRDAVGLVAPTGRSINSMAKGLGVNTESLRMGSALLERSDPVRLGAGSLGNHGQEPGRHCATNGCACLRLMCNQTLQKVAGMELGTIER
ncbi:hypothetical protein ACFRQM_49640, partial [Streptomyces sp. NPDC056831]|uniref:hypothetical protein n=1 Tax=Streptomyces sp. NPDC056831 TaxID=3345954 RepID=UPI00367CF2DF